VRIAKAKVRSVGHGKPYCGAPLQRVSLIGTRTRVSSWD